MKKQLMMFMMFLPAMLFATLAHADTAYYVQSTNATVRSDPSFGAKVIAKVTKGQMLTSTSKSGDWIKVKVDGKDGYISHLLVTTHPPLEKTTVIKAEEQEIKPTARRRASSFTSAAAARGLTDEEQKHEGEGTAEKSDYKALDKMEAVKVTPDEVKKFKETGK
jgi:uncharacterized protein YgiM (DUF1202 family)